MTDLNALCAKLNAIVALAELNPNGWNRPSGRCEVKGDRICCPCVTGDSYWYEYVQLADGSWACDSIDGVQWLIDDEAALLTDFGMFWVAVALNLTPDDVADGIRQSAGVRFLELGEHVETGREEWLLKWGE